MYLTHYGVKGMKWGVRRYRNKDGSLTPLGKKKTAEEAAKQAKKRSTDLFVGSSNYAAGRINGKWLNDFNKKWSKEFKGYYDWSDSPKYKDYINAYTKKLVGLSNEYLKTDKKSQFTTKTGETYTARFLEEHGQRVMWGTPEEWAEYESKRKG